MRYRDVAAAIDWLSTAFGFTKHQVVTGDDGTIRYGLLTFGDGMIVVWPVGESDFDGLMRQPDEIGGVQTQTCYFVVEDADSHYHHAKAAGAQIVLDLKEYEYLGRGYSCRDPEGHIWHFGTYDPWQSVPVAASPRFRIASGHRGQLASFLLVAGLLATMIAVATAGWILGHSSPNEQEARQRTEALAAANQRAEEIAKRAAVQATELTQVHREKDVAERRASGALEQIAKERTAAEAAQRVIAESRKELTLERDAKQRAERASEETLRLIAKERTAAEAAQRTLAETKRQLTLERDAKQRAERASEDGLRQLARERSAKEAAERAANEARERLAAAQTAKNNGAQPAEQPSAKPAKQHNAKRTSGKSPEPTMPRLVP